MAVSTASILIRYAQAQGMGEMAIAAYRLLFAAALLTPFAARTGCAALLRLTQRERLRIVAAGVCLAIHFAAWISSLAFTSVASSVALVTSHPLWVAVAAFLFLGERPGWPTIGGVALTLLGAATIMWSDQSAGIGSAPLLGNILAIIGALSVAAYILLARSLRHALGTLDYVWAVYGLSAAFLVLAAAGTGALFSGITLTGMLFVLAMAAGPQLVGHTAINYAARHLRPTLVSVAILGEPVLSAAFAWMLLGETLAVLQLSGFAVTLCGILLCALDDRSPVKEPR